MFTVQDFFLEDRRKKSIAPRIVGNPLKNLIPAERIQDNPHKSKPPRARGPAEKAPQIAGAKRFQISGRPASRLRRVEASVEFARPVRRGGRRRADDWAFGAQAIAAGARMRRRIDQQHYQHQQAQRRNDQAEQDSARFRGGPSDDAPRPSCIGSDPGHPRPNFPREMLGADCHNFVTCGFEAKLSSKCAPDDRAID